MNIINKLENSIFRINTGRGTGTGFYNAESNLIVTNHHVIEGSLEVSVEDKDRNRFKAYVTYVHPGKDIAFLNVVGMPNVGSTVDVVPNSEVNARDKVLVLGYPFGMPFTVTEGIVSNPNQLVQGSNFIQTDAAINPGNSGGPIISEEGVLIGIATSKLNNADNMGFAIPSQSLQEELAIASDLKAKELTVGCHSCNGLIQNKAPYCPNCGADINTSDFNADPISELAQKVEESIIKLGIDPVLTRSGTEFWLFHQGSAEIRMFIYHQNYLFATSPINDLPRTNLEELYTYLLTEDVGPYRLAISENKIFISYRAHISDLYSSHSDEILQNFAGLALKADELDNHLADTFGAKMSKFSKED